MGVLFLLRMPYCIGDLKRDPTLGNYPYPVVYRVVYGSGFRGLGLRYEGVLYSGLRSVS